MKLKKILAFACSLVMASSMFVATANAAVDGVTATLEFAGYEVKGTTTFAKINVKATIPDTLVPYELVAADWVETFEDTYKGKMLQSVGFDIPNVTGLAYVASLSSCAEYVQIQDNKTGNKISVYAANSGAYDTYYAGTIDTLATLYYRITGDVNATYNLSLSSASLNFVDVAADGSVTPWGYTSDNSDFTITNAVVKPADPEPEPEPVAALSIEVAEGYDKDAGYVWGLDITKAADTAINGFKAEFTTGTESTERNLDAKNVGLLNSFVAEGTGATRVWVGLKTAKEVTDATFTVTDAANTTVSDSWK